MNKVLLKEKLLEVKKELESKDLLYTMQNNDMHREIITESAYKKCIERYTNLNNISCDIFEEIISNTDSDVVIDRIVESVNEGLLSDIKFESGHTEKEYMEKFGDLYEDGMLWDFSMEDLEDGAVELDENHIYWIIDGRCYETTIKVEDVEEKNKEKNYIVRFYEDEMQEEPTEYIYRFEGEDKAIETAKRLVDKEEMFKTEVVKDGKVIYKYDGSKEQVEENKGFQLREDLNLKIKQAVEEIQKEFEKDKKFFEVWYDLEEKEIFVDVDGDWKHEHLYCDNVVKKVLEKCGLAIVVADVEVTEEDGSDWYVGIHWYEVAEKVNLKEDTKKEIELTVEEKNMLDKLTHGNKMDAWFYIDDKNDRIIDLENEDKELDVCDAVLDIDDGTDDVSEFLDEKEVKLFKDLVRRCKECKGISLEEDVKEEHNDQAVQYWANEVKFQIGEYCENHGLEKPSNQERNDIAFSVADFIVYHSDKLWSDINEYIWDCLDDAFSEDLMKQFGESINESDVKVETKEEIKLETFEEQMDFLAKDEQEAIDGYEKVIELVKEEHVKEQLEKILIEEKAHKEFLENVKKDHSLVYTEPLEVEEKEEIEIKESEEDGELNIPLARKIGKMLLPQKKKKAPRYCYEVYWYDNEEWNGDPIFKKFWSRKAQEQWYLEHKDDADKFGMWTLNGYNINESLKEKLCEEEYKDEEYCVIVDGNNVDCFETEEEAIKCAREEAQDEQNKLVKVLLVKYGPKDEHGDKSELGFETIWATSFKEEEVKESMKDRLDNFIKNKKEEECKECNIKKDAGNVEKNIELFNKSMGQEVEGSGEVIGEDKEAEFAKAKRDLKQDYYTNPKNNLEKLANKVDDLSYVVMAYVDEENKCIKLETLWRNSPRIIYNDYLKLHKFLDSEVGKDKYKVVIEMLQNRDGNKEFNYKIRVELLDELEEASTAFKKAVKTGKDVDDYLDGKAIARVKDKDERDRLIALKKLDKKNKLGGRKSAADELERKRVQADDNYAKKAKKYIKDTEGEN